MAGSQIVIMANQVEKQRAGFQSVSLTNFSSDTLEPTVAAGSKIEIGGALYEFPANESITGWAGIAVSSDVYIHLTASGSSVTASFSVAAPMWSEASNGWYSGSARVIGGLYKDGSGNYSGKWLYLGGLKIHWKALGNDMVPTAAIRDAAVTTDKLADGAVTTDKLADAAVTGPKIDTAFSASGVKTVAAGQYYVLPAGLYIVIPYAGDGFYLELKDGSIWRSSLEPFSGGVIISDGTNVRLNAPGTQSTYAYRKL